MRITGERELTIYLDNLAKRSKPAMVNGLKQAANHLEDKIKEKFGKYQKGWPKLKRETVLAKYRKRALKGMKSSRFSRLIATRNVIVGADDPLVLFGQLKDSIKHEVYETDLKAVVYSDAKYAAVHEYGYKHVPARSYMRSTLYDEEEEIFRMINNKIGRLI